MLEGNTFIGFNEGPINFAPTFKYDVLRTLKRSKTRGSRHSWKYSERHNPLYEVEEPDRDDEEGDDDGEAEDASMASSVWTSFNSRPPSDDDDFFSSHAQAVSAPNLAHKLSISAAAYKAKTKWMTLLTATSMPGTPVGQWRRPQYCRTAPSTPNIRELESTPPRLSTDMAATPPPYTLTKSISPESARSGLPRPRDPIRSTSVKSAHQSGDEDTDDEDKGVYDSSNKKRVPSWYVEHEMVHIRYLMMDLDRCDRILWKSTVHPHPDPEEFVEMYRPRTRVGQFFVNALRPLTSRGRRESMSSLNSVEVPSLPPKMSPITVLSPTHDEPRDMLDGTTPLSQFIKRSRSNDLLCVTESLSPSSLTRSKSSSSRYNLRLRRSLSADQLQPQSPVPSPPASRPPSYPSSPAMDYGPPPPVPPKDSLSAIPSRWRFFPFLSREVPPSPIEPSEPPVSDLLSPPKKGDVMCLSYNTLDDRGMRRLEGRSDHRPVIGSYAVYL